jgi:hypothetical protein
MNYVFAVTHFGVINVDTEEEFFLSLDWEGAMGPIEAVTDQSDQLLLFSITFIFTTGTNLNLKAIGRANNWCSPETRRAIVQSIILIREKVTEMNCDKTRANCQLPEEGIAWAITTVNN